MKILLADNGLHLRFAPLTLTRPVGNLRMGILTNDERWEELCPDAEIYYETEEYLQGKFEGTNEYTWRVNAAVIPNEELIAIAQQLSEGDYLVDDNTWLIQVGNNPTNRMKYVGENLIVLEERWDLFQRNGEVLKADFALLTEGRETQPLSDSNTVIGDPALIFVEDGVTVEACILNTKTGPIYLGENSEIMEGSVIRGPFALCEEAQVKLATKVYGPTTVGPHCRIGGEVNNVVMQAYSNKGHDGFLGNAVIGEWCNLGADTNSSNLKNNYSNVKAYSYETGHMENTDVQFMGVIMGDHSKCGINTMFNTATVVGVSANIYGGDFPSKKIDSFTWGGPDGFVDFDLKKAEQVAIAMMERRHIEFTEEDHQIFQYLSKNHR
ncbi:MAG: glucose-1-phosphate thymidylyltransferase [Crocinitomicaceae bacterium]|nr:glucose-1-phosphate thymidylyltransferase [Crocinitomicaceae bacterium]